MTQGGDAASKGGALHPPTPCAAPPAPAPAPAPGYLLQQLQGGILVPGQVLGLLHGLSPDLPGLTVQHCQALLEGTEAVSRALAPQG